MMMIHDDDCYNDDHDDDCGDDDINEDVFFHRYFIQRRQKEWWVMP